MARSIAIVSLALISVLLLSANAQNTPNYTNISSSIQCQPQLFFNGGNSIFCDTGADFLITVNISPPAVGQPIGNCDSGVEPFLTHSSNSFYCLNSTSAGSSDFSLSSYVQFNPWTGALLYQTPYFNTSSTFTKGDSILFALANNNGVNISIIYQNEQVCSYSNSSFSDIYDFQYYGGVAYLLLMNSSNYFSVLSVNCANTTDVAVVYSPSNATNPFFTHAGLDMFTLVGAPTLLIFDPNLDHPISVNTATLSTVNVSGVAKSRNIKKIYPISDSTFIAVSSCNITLYAFAPNSFSNVTVSQNYNAGWCYFKTNYVPFSNLFYYDDTFNYFFFDLLTFKFNSIYSFNPSIPLGNGSNIYVDHTGFFVETPDGIKTHQYTLPWGTNIFYVVPPYNNYYMLASQTTSYSLISINVNLSTVSVIPVDSSLTSKISQNLYAVVETANGTCFAAEANGGNSVGLWCNGVYTEVDNKDNSVVFIDTANNSIILIEPSVAQFKYNESIYGTVQGSNIQLVDVFSNNNYLTANSGLDNSILSNCNFGVFDAPAGSGSIANGFFATCGSEGNQNYVVSQYGGYVSVPGTINDFIEIYGNNTFYYCEADPLLSFVEFCQMSNVTYWGVQAPASSSGSSAWWVVLLILFILGGAGAYYWFVYRKQHMAAKESSGPDHYSGLMGHNDSLGQTNDN